MIYQRNFSGKPHIFDKAQLAGDNADIGRHPELQNNFHFRFSLPVLVDISSSGFRPMSDGVGNDIAKSAMVANVEVAVGIASLTLSVPKLFPLPVFDRHFQFWI